MSIIDEVTDATKESKIASCSFIKSFRHLSMMAKNSRGCTKAAYPMPGSLMGKGSSNNAIPPRLNASSNTTRRIDPCTRTLLERGSSSSQMGIPKSMHLENYQDVGCRPCSHSCWRQAATQPPRRTGWTCLHPQLRAASKPSGLHLEIACAV